MFTIFRKKDADPPCYITTSPTDSRMVQWTIEDKCYTKKILDSLGGSPILLNLDEGYERIELRDLPSEQLRDTLETFYRGVP